MRPIIALILLCFAFPSLAAEPLRMTTGATEPVTRADMSGFLDRISVEAFKRIGREIVIERLPPARALKQANSGKSDGDLQRTRGLEKRYPNLVRVEEPLYTHDFVAFAKEKDLRTTGWDSLKGQKLGYLRGWEVYRKNVPEDAVVTLADSPKSLFDLMKRDRVDLILFSKWSGLWWTKQANVALKMLEPPLVSIDVYIYLNREHIGLAPKLEAALKDMKEDGTWQRIYSETLALLLGHTN